MVSTNPQRDLVPQLPTRRLDQVDALRGVAAMAVVLFHLTSRYGDLIPTTTRPWFNFWVGQYGVNLFFMISGFVILMTLERTRSASDFVVARFSRLYPTYWVCIALTYSLTLLIGPAQELIAPVQALANGLMFHGLLHVPNLDAAYWTLDVELLFYAGMLALYSKGQLQRAHLWLVALLALRWAYYIARVGWGVDLPWIVYRVLILTFLPWFMLGLSIHTLSEPERFAAQRWQAMVCGAAALATLFITESWPMGAMGVAFSALLYAAATNRLPALSWKPLVWLGSISYPLYLLHENIGWSLMRRLQAQGWTMNSSSLVALVVALLLAWAVSRWVERPSLRWIRQAWRERAAKRHGPSPA